MNKVSHKYTKTFGFTLIELVLVMGITVIFLSVCFAVFTIINTSHARVAIINDAKDFADLNMQAIENLISDATAVTLTDTTSLQSGEQGYTSIYFKTDSTKDSALWYFVDGSTEQKAFTWNQYYINNKTQKKWSVLTSSTDPIFTKTTTPGIVHVKIQIIDNVSGKVYYTIQKDIILLNIKSAAAITNTSGNVIKVKYFTP